MECRLCRLPAEDVRVTPWGTVRLCKSHGADLDEWLTDCGDIREGMVVEKGEHQPRPLETARAVRVSCRYGPARDDVL